MKKLVIVAAFAILAACAEKAANIEPAAISSAKYEGWNCRKLAKEKAFVEEALIRASGIQDKAAQNDTMMVILIGVPTSNGGIKSEVARLKGEKEALRVAMRDRGCRI